MITNEQVVAYLRALEPQKDTLIESIEKEALENKVPIIKKEAQGLIRILLALIKPKRILEIGTAVGFSSILMSEYLKPGGEIITIERNAKMIEIAKENIKKVNKEHLITIIEEDAEVCLKTLEGPFDVIFMDAAKGQYLNFLPYCIELLKEQGLLISDNVLQDGKIAKSRYAIPRRQRTIHTRMRDYLWEIKHHPLLETSILPVADGMTLSYKRSN